MNSSDKIDYTSYEAAVERSKKIEADLPLHPGNYRLLTGDRPTGRLHIGHYFGSLQNRVELFKMGVPTYILIADYQVLTDHDAYDQISENTKQLVIDYIAAGLDPESETLCIFPHSYIPELNQLLLPFLTLVSNSELDRNPTVKEEILASGKKSINAGMYIYPVHQAADILAVKGNVVPVGKDQLPHLELTRTIARRFNEKYISDEPVFPEAQALLSKTPSILGLDGAQKMSKSRNNYISLSATEDETETLIKKAKTDAERRITYDPENRPEVANLLLLLSLTSGEKPEVLAEKIGDGGGGALKKMLADSMNEFFRPMRTRRAELEKDPDYIDSVLFRGIDRARAEAGNTLDQVRRAMNMEI
ncbi:tryptophan--tRNA ligase [Brucepastera parasyntrophica]|uniref:tryptophan--tRNA ligase n=1 Tax=Brucepastera parasyntrophica TaxID=2880008 RepID=UPI00210989A8|nr:tryptophan--tRNA ligase [Brucepastera parasyntrophica]ULQ59612.1 tryptophan--tRNA ligase [Brucepastera parasyntrophica]